MRPLVDERLLFLSRRGVGRGRRGGHRGGRPAAGGGGRPAGVRSRHGPLVFRRYVLRVLTGHVSQATRTSTIILAGTVACTTFRAS